MSESTLVTLPDTNIQVLGAVPDLNYFDRQSIKLPNSITPLEAWRILMARPMPILKLAFYIRDVISGWFGVKRIGGFTTDAPRALKAGDNLDFFLVEYISPEVLTLTARDKHLDVMTCVSTLDDVLTITSSVKIHNTFGWFYMLPVGIAHKVIVRTMLKRLKRELTQA